MQILIEDYNPLWGRLFESVRGRLLTAIGFANPQIEHIGSTSMRGMMAKPIIDILIGLPNQEQLNDIIAPLNALGYTYIKKFEQDVPNRRFFVFSDNFEPQIIDCEDEFPSGNQSRKFHIHAFECKSYDWNRHIAMRDFLRVNDSEMKAYKEFKYRLSKMDFEGTLDYSEAKDSFLKDLERKSLEWYKIEIKDYVRN